jgi:multicomponent K+:H+ antiporter subunit E
MKRLLPSPLISLTVLVLWLLLNDTLAPGQVLMGAVLAVVVPLATARLRPDQPRIRRPMTVVRLGLTVLHDIVVANVQVAVRILGPERRLAPRFIWLPLDIRDPHGIAALAGIITMTPGTLSSDLTPDRRHLLVHALDARDPQAVCDEIKRRYEAPLMEIFG